MTPETKELLSTIITAQITESADSVDSARNAFHAFVCEKTRTILGSKCPEGKCGAPKPTNDVDAEDLDDDCLTDTKRKTTADPD